MSPDHNFLFASLDSKPPPTTRKVHIRRLYDVLELCIQRNDFVRAKRAWTILIRCKEFRWEEHWTTGLYILNEGGASTDNIPRRIEYLRAMMLRDIDKETMLKELILLLILSGQYQKALDELELYLPSFPYQDNPVLHIYAGLLSLQLAQSKDGSQVLDSSLIRGAQSHLNQAQSIDPSNTITQAFLQKINTLQKRTDENGTIDSEDETMQVDDSTPKRKRIRKT
ncbi:hypothetical protein P691DRAFT_755836 [Macrolepiota fuliginosa MF-IS2]|uniref:Uncharacterized protein n=1 Tax=Macrolepiota fuliginosa MF-IS2 TaxID=1400762 RepID=A0A9P5XLN4_9AGAR|nr:hypothetical protein P691DRAFT_755836 [Macrolepiota fuliginosa MF-IS2]